MKYYRIPKRIISIVIILIMIFNLVGCELADKGGEAIADKIVDDYTAKITDALQQNKPYDPNGEILSEDVLSEDVKREDILNEELLLEEQLSEKILNELILDEKIMQEDVLIEAVNVEVYKNAEDWDGDEFTCESYCSTNLDYDLIKQNIAKGCSLVITEVIIDVGSVVLDIVTAQWWMIPIDLGQIVIMAGGTTLKAFVEYQVEKAKSEASGKSYEEVMFDAMDAASNSFYYTAVVLDKVMTAISLVQMVIGIKNLITKLKKNVKIISPNDDFVVKKVNNYFEIVTDSGKKTTKCLPVSLKDATSVDLYDIATKKYVCTLVEEGDAFVVKIKTVPKVVVNKSNKVVFEIDESGNIYKITKNSAGEQTRVLKGTVDEGGFITDGFGRLVERVDLETGKTLKCYNSINSIAAQNISVDVFGNIIDINTGEKLTSKAIDGITYYYDSSNAKVLQIYDGNDNIKWLQNTENGRTVGMINEDGFFDSGWKNYLDASRSDATRTIRNKLVEYVNNHKDSEIRKLFPDLTLEDLEYIRANGKVPSTIQIHHCKNVANYPDLAHDYTNLEVMSKESHLAAHDGSYLNSTNAKSSNYIDLKELFDLSNEFAG